MRHTELGYRYFYERRIAQAVEQFRLAAERGEDPEAAALERWLTMMTAGEFEEAWRESDRVLARRKRAGETCGHLPRHLRFVWDGTALAGRDVLVRCYHGLGDVIQFIRYVPELARVCRSVSVQCQAELLELVGTVPGIARLVALEDDDPPHDAEIELMEVPHALRAAVADIPAHVPYLKPGGARVDGDGRFRVGLAWASGVWKPERSIPISSFSFLRDMPEVAVVGLQRGPATNELPGDAPEFIDTDWANTSVTDTAAAMANLDLIIAPDTMVAHLAGALGKPVWTLLHFHADWRWMADREDSPWYPTMRLFRQRVDGDWADVVGRVEAELKGKVRG